MEQYKKWLEEQIEVTLEDKDLQREHWAYCTAYKKLIEALPIHSVMQAEGSDGVSGAAVGNSAAGQSGSEGVMKWCDSCGKITKWIDGDCENYKTRGGSDKGALPR